MPERLLTEVELEIMTAVWKQTRCTVREVLAQLNPARKLAYTSVATVMKILEEKGVLQSEKNEKTHTYWATLSRDEYERRALNHLNQKLFRGDLPSMVMRLLDDADLSKEDIKTIRKLLDRRTPV